MMVTFAGEPLDVGDPEATPMGWTADGRGLLVRRDGFEIWTPRGEPL